MLFCIYRTGSIVQDGIYLWGAIGADGEHHSEAAEENGVMPFEW